VAKKQRRARRVLAGLQMVLAKGRGALLVLIAAPTAVHFRTCRLSRLFREDAVAAELDSESHLVPWQGVRKPPPGHPESRASPASARPAARLPIRPDAPCPIALLPTRTRPRRCAPAAARRPSVSVAHPLTPRDTVVRARALAHACAMRHARR